MLQLPDDPFASLELVHDPARPVKDTGAVNHLVVQVDDLNATIADLAPRGVTAEPPTEPGPGIRTSWLTDPDGHRIAPSRHPTDTHRPQRLVGMIEPDRVSAAHPNYDVARPKGLEPPTF